MFAFAGFIAGLLQTILGIFGVGHVATSTSVQATSATSVQAERSGTPESFTPSFMFSADPQSGAPPLSVSFGAFDSNSVDGVGSASAHPGIIDFGDGSAPVSLTISHGCDAGDCTAMHTYARAGLYLVSYTDEKGTVIATTSIGVQ